MALSSLLAFAVALIVTAGSPGPSVAALVARVLTNGIRDVLPFLAAMWLGEALWLTAAVGGLTVLAQTFALAFLAAAITPGDVVTATILLTIPLVLLYELGIWLAKRRPGTSG